MRAALSAYDKSRLKRPSREVEPDKRFQGRSPIQAIRILLGEAGGKMKRAALMSSLMQGGAALGKKRGEHNLRISIEVNISNGNLVASGDSIALPR